MTEKKKPDLDQILGIGAVLFVLIGCYVILQPFFVGIVWSIILVYSTWSIHKALRERIVKSRTVAALLMTALSASFFLFPFVFVFNSIAEDSRDLVLLLREILDQGLPDPPDWLHGIPFIGPMMNDYWVSMSHDGQALIREMRGMLPEIRTVLLRVGEIISLGIGQLTLGIFLAFFVYRDGDRIFGYVSSLSVRLIGGNSRKLLSLVGETITGVVYGVVGTAIAQGFLAGVGFAIAGVPAAALLGLLTFFVSFIPMAPPLVWAPVAAWLYWSNGVGMAVFMLVWGAFVISGIDNILKPWLISQGAQLPFAVVFLGIAGGVLGFGVVGVFIGPILLAVGMNLLLVWTNRDREVSS